MTPKLEEKERYQAILSVLVTAEELIAKDMTQTTSRIWICNAVYAACRRLGLSIVADELVIDHLCTLGMKRKNFIHDERYYPSQIQQDKRLAFLRQAIEQTRSLT